MVAGSISSAGYHEIRFPIAFCIFCLINCQNIFDCRFFLFTFIKSSQYTYDWVFLFHRKRSTYFIQRSLYKKIYHSLLIQKEMYLPSSIRNNDTFEEQDWTIKFHLMQWYSICKNNGSQTPFFYNQDLFLLPKTKWNTEFDNLNSSHWFYFLRQ